MPIVFGAGVSYSPLLYRQRSEWPAISQFLVKDVTQPKSRELETDGLLSEYEQRINASLGIISRAIEKGRLDALIVLIADRGDVFDESDVPQLHIQVGGEVWGDTAIPELDEPSQVSRFACATHAAELVIEELVRAGFDISEGRGAFQPLGVAGRGISRAASEAVARLGSGLPIIPVHVNCHIEPVLSGRRLHAFGCALAKAANLTEQRLGIFVSGGMSGDAGGPMAGWVDDVLDEWVLSRITRGQSAEIAQIWDAKSRTLKGNSAEIRLWTVAAAALEQENISAQVIDYMPVHHSAAGLAFVTWEQMSCQ